MPLKVTIKNYLLKRIPIPRLLRYWADDSMSKAPVSSRSVRYSVWKLLVPSHTLALPPPTQLILCDKLILGEMMFYVVRSLHLRVQEQKVIQVELTVKENCAMSIFSGYQVSWVWSRNRCWTQQGYRTQDRVLLPRTKSGTAHEETHWCHAKSMEAAPGGWCPHHCPDEQQVSMQPAQAADSVQREES